MSYLSQGYHTEQWDYRIYLDGATYFAIPGDTGSGLSALQNANNVTLLQAALDALPATGGTIFLDMEGVQFLGTITINKPRIILTTYSVANLNAFGEGVLIRTITFDSSTEDITDCVLEGFTWRQINFNPANANHIAQIYIRDCRFNISTAANSRGVFMNATATTGEYVEGITFEDCRGITINNTVGDGGFLTATGGDTGVGNSAWHFVRCWFVLDEDNIELFVMQDGSALDRIRFLDCVFVANDAGDTHELVHIASQTSLSRGFDFEFEHCLYENHSTVTFLSVVLATQNTTVSFKMHGCKIAQFGTVVLMNNLNTLWTAVAGRHGAFFEDNMFMPSAGLTLGTSGAATLFPVRIVNNMGYNPVGNIATPFPAGAGFLLDSAAAQAFPTTATLYTIAESPKLVVISGGVVTNIQIDGVICGLTSGAFYLEPEQTIEVVWTGQPLGVVSAC